MGGWTDIIKDPEDLKQVIADTKEPLFLVYYADWCPDCQATKPILEKTFGTDKAPTAVQVMVGERPAWKASSNFRQEPFKISNIPTLVRMEKCQEVGRLVEGQILDQAALAKFIT